MADRRLDRRVAGAARHGAKSFTSALIGIAIDDGLLSGVDQRLADFFPEWRGTTREAITLRDVLWMSSGLAWDEDYTPDDVSDIIQMIVLERDHVAYAASRPLAVEPGTRFSYSSGDTMLLSGLLEAATGGTAEAYAQRKLFGPIGMGPVEWWRDASGHTVTYCCLDTPAAADAPMVATLATLMAMMRGGNLTDAQRDQARDRLDAARDGAESTRTALREANEQLAAASHAPPDGEGDGPRRRPDARNGEDATAVTAGRCRTAPAGPRRRSRRRSES